jgi:hypothetical protein
MEAAVCGWQDLVDKYRGAYAVKGKHDNVRYELGLACLMPESDQQQVLNLVNPL